MCRATPEFNLSYESLTSRQAKQALNELAITDPSFYAEITKRSTLSQDVSASELGVGQLSANGAFPEDDISANFDASEPDDTSLTMKQVIARTMDADKNTEPVQEDADYASVETEEPQVAEPDRHSKRRRVPNKRYDLASWCRYDDDSGNEM